MSFAALDPRQKLGAASAFGLVVAVWCMIVLLLAHRRAQRERLLRERLEFASGQAQGPRTLRLWHDGREATTLVPGLAVEPTWGERLRQLGRDAGWKATPGRVLTQLVLSALLAGLAVALITGRPIAGAALVGVIVIVFGWVTGRQMTKRAELFERQLVDALELSSRALRVGHSLIGSLKLIAEEVPEPVGTIFKEICQQQELGARAEDSLMRAAALSKSSDLRLFATSLAINLRAGGNLADVMEGLAFVIRERMRLGRRFRVLSAQTHASKRILLAMPVLMFFLMNFLNPEYMKVFYGTFVGGLLLVSASCSMLLGWFVMNRMSVIRH